MKLSLVLLLAVALAGAHAKRDLLQQNCQVSVDASATGQASDAISQAVTTAFASCKAAGNQAACGAGCQAYSTAAGQAISQAFAKAAVAVFASVKGDPGCKLSASAKGNAQSQARAVASSYAQAISQLCNGAQITQWEKTVVDALTRVYAYAAVDVACKNGGNAQAAVNVVASNTLTAIACSISQAFSQCICKTPTAGFSYADTCWTGIISDPKLDATAAVNAAGSQCQALASGSGGSTTGNTPSNFPPPGQGQGGFNPPPGATVFTGTTSQGGGR